MDHKLSFGEIISFAFKTGIRNFPSLLGCVVLWFLTFWIPYINVGTTIALSTLPAMLSRGEVISPLRIFDGSYRRCMGEYFLALGLKNLVVAPGVLFAFVPAIIMHITYSLTTLLVVDKARPATEAMSLSLKATEGHRATIFFWTVFVFVVLTLIPFLILQKIWTPLALIYVLVSSVVGLAGKAYIYGQLTAHIPDASENQSQGFPVMTTA